VEDETTGRTSISPTFSLNRQSPISKAKLVVDGRVLDGGRGNWGAT
jgi:hypothetical protein